MEQPFSQEALVSLITDAISKEHCSVAEAYADIFRIRTVAADDIQRVLVKVGWKLLKNGHPEKGVDLIRQIPVQEYTDKTRVSLGKMLLEQGRAEEADQVCNDVTDKMMLVELQPEKFLNNPESLSPKFQKQLAEWCVQHGRTDDGIRIAKIMMYENNDLADLRWFCAFALRLQCYADLANACIDFLTTNKSYDTMQYLTGIASHLLDQHSESTDATVRIWKAAIENIPGMTRSCESFVLRLREKGHQTEADELASLCALMSKAEKKKALDHLKNKEKNNRRVAVRKKRKKVEKDPAKVLTNIEHAKTHMGNGDFENALSLLAVCVPSIARATFASEAHWKALAMLAQCAGKLKNVDPLVNRVGTYLKHDVISEEFARYLYSIAERAAIDPKDLPELEIGPYYMQYVRSRGMRAIIDQEIPKDGPKGQSAVDASVLHNSNATRTDSPRKKRHA